MAAVPPPPRQAQSLMVPSSTNFSWSRLGSSLRNPRRTWTDVQNRLTSPQLGPTVQFTSVEEAGDEEKEEGRPETDAETIESLRASQAVRTMPRAVSSAHDRIEKLDELEERAENIEEGCRVLEVRGKGLLDKARAENRRMKIYAIVAGCIVVILIIVVVAIVCTRRR